MVFPHTETMPHMQLILVALPIQFILAKVDDEVTNKFGSGLQLKRCSGHTNAILVADTAIRWPYLLAIYSRTYSFGEKSWNPAQNSARQPGCAVAKSTTTTGACELFTILVT